MKTKTPIIEVKHLNKMFGSFIALHDINLKIYPGERIGLIGSNGAGKTTLTEIIAGINSQTSGEIKYNFEYNKSPKEKIGMQFQQSVFPSGLTVKDLLKFSIRLRKIKISDKELKDLLKIFQMEDFYLRKARSLSGGQKQKLNILMSILHNPKVVILDELSTGLDIAAREDIIKFTNNILKKKKMTAILISHHMAEIRELCDKVFIMSNGKIIKEETIKEIEKKYGSLDKLAKSLIRKEGK